MKRSRKLEDAFAGFTVVCSKIACGKYDEALQQLTSIPEGPPEAAPTRAALNALLGERKKR